MTYSERLPHYPTLFARYKDFINNFCMNRSTQDPSRFPYYTAKELNEHVGMYESTTWWKRANNNPYYTTRTYQSMLKNLGCISMVKRGLWKINAPIPEWFGSFHFNGLKGNLSDPSNIYWNSLPAEHKVNPWKLGANAPDGWVILADQTRCTIYDIPVTPALFDLTCDCDILASHVNGGYDANIIRYNCKLNGVVIPDSMVLTLSKAYGFDLDECTKLVDAKALEEFYLLAQFYLLAPELPTTTAKKPEPSKERLYTASEVQDILKNFTEKLQTSVMSNVENLVESIDESDILDLDFDSYNRSITVDLDNRELYRKITGGIEDTFTDMLDEMEEALKHIDSKS